MTGIYFNGRLGNQLFQFCFFQYLKSRKENGVVFFENPHHAYLTRYFDLGKYNVFLGWKIFSVPTRIFSRLIKFKNKYVHNFVAPKHHAKEHNVIYHGYFQTEWYLKHTPDPISFRIKKKYRQDFATKFGSVFEKNKTVVVHVRRTDYLNYGKRDISVPIRYFKDCLSGIADLDSYKVFFLSDDMDYVKSQIEVRPNFIFSHNSEIIDFQIIQHADIAIISNSSFSWWAAYLGKKGNVVYAPKNWLGYHVGREHPKGIMTDRFIWKT